MTRTGSTFISRALFVLLAGAIVVVSVLVARSVVLGGDGRAYLLPVHNWFAGLGFTLDGHPHLHFPPGYGLLAYPLYRLVGNVELSGMLVSAGAYLGLIVLAFAVGRRVFDDLAGLIAAFLVAISPSVIGLSYATLSDLPFACILVMALYVNLRLDENTDRPGWGPAAALGGLLGFAYLVRPEGFLVGLAVIGMLALGAWRTRKRGDGEGRGKNRVLLWRPLVVATVFVLLAAPYMAFLYRHTGHVSISGKFATVFVIWGETVEEDIDPQLLEERHPQYARPGAQLDIVDYLRERGSRFLLRVKRNVANEILYTAKVLFHALAAVVVLWLVLPLSRSRDPAIWRPGPAGRRFARIAAPYMTPLLALLAFFITERFVVPYAIVLMIAMGGVLSKLATATGERLGPLLVAVSVLAPLTYPAQAVWSYALDAGSHSVPDTLVQAISARNVNMAAKAAGLWLRDFAVCEGPCSALSAGKASVVAHYASSDARPWRVRNVPPDLPLAKLAEFADRHAADYIVLDAHYVHAVAALGSLWREPGLAAELGFPTIVRDPHERFVLLGRAAIRRPAAAEAGPRAQ